MGKKVGRWNSRSGRRVVVVGCAGKGKRAKSRFERLEGQRSREAWTTANDTECRRWATVDAAGFVQVQKSQDVSDITSLVDQRMSSSFTSEGIREFVQLIVWCLNPIGERRPLSSYLVSELDRIREKEINLTTIRGEGTTTVTLGSQLFK